MKILLDTSTCINLLRGTGGEVAARFRAHKPSDLVIGSVILAELRAGAELSRDPAEAHGRIDLLLDSVAGLPFTDQDARAFGRINADLIRRKLADHIDDMDKLIAAHAITHGLRGNEQREGLRPHPGNLLGELAHRTQGVAQSLFCVATWV